VYDAECSETDDAAVPHKAEENTLASGSSSQVRERSLYQSPSDYPDPAQEKERRLHSLNETVHKQLCSRPALIVVQRHYKFDGEVVLSDNLFGSSTMFLDQCGSIYGT